MIAFVWCTPAHARQSSGRFRSCRVDPSQVHNNISCRMTAFAKIVTSTRICSCRLEDSKVILVALRTFREKSAKLTAVPGVRMGERATQTSVSPERARGGETASSSASSNTAAQRMRRIPGCIFVFDAPAAAQTLGAGETIFTILFSRE